MHKNMNGKEIFLSNCEKTFIKKAISGGIRHDGRTQYEFRDLRINFGVDYGCVYVCLGETRILGQVTCEIQQPKNVRPNEGILTIHLELGPMAAPHFEIGRSSNLAILVNRALEKCFKDSKVLNLESLCIRAGVKVWNIRLDLNVLNFDGNLVDAASITALAALAHFRRPDVTFTGTDITIYSFSDREPIPLIIQHYPVYITYAFFNKGKRLIADPTALEERVAEGQVSLGVNAYKELCGLHLEGNTSVDSELVLTCASRAGKRAKKVVDLIKITLEEDKRKRQNDEPIGFDLCSRLNSVLAYSKNSISFKTNNYRKLLKKESREKLNETMVINEKNPVIKQFALKTAELIRYNDAVEVDSD